MLRSALPQFVLLYCLSVCTSNFQFHPNSHSLSRSDPPPPPYGPLPVRKQPFSRWVGCLQEPKNHLEERLLDQAQARASYTPPFGGHSRSIPQGMTCDAQPLVKSLLCPIRQSPNGFFDSDASIPSNWISIFRGGGGGVKSLYSTACAQKGLNEGQIGQSRQVGRCRLRSTCLLAQLTV